MELTGLSHSAQFPLNCAAEEAQGSRSALSQHERERPRASEAPVSTPGRHRFGQPEPIGQLAGRGGERGEGVGGVSLGMVDQQQVHGAGKVGSYGGGGLSLTGMAAALHAAS